MEKNTNFIYKKLSPFKWFVLENFPFIEADFDALTEWQLFCKIGKEINKIIDSQNIVGDQAETLTNTFNTLKNYVDNYFNNLDVQDEINNKLNEMASDGTLANIINQEVFSEINTKIDKNTFDLSLMKNRKIIVIGDSYTAQSFEDITKFWHQYFRDNLNLISGSSLFVKGTPGGGFISGDFLKDLQTFENLENKNTITDIFVVGGWNDRTATASSLLTAMTNFNNYAKANFVNAKISVAYVGNSNPIIRQTNENRIGRYTSIQYYIENCAKLQWRYIKNAEYVLHNYNSSYWETDGVHPAQAGQTYMGNQLSLGFINGFCDVINKNLTAFINAQPSGICTALNTTKFISGINNNYCYLNKYQEKEMFTLDVNNTNMSFNGATIYELLKINDGFFAGTSSETEVSVPCFIQYTDATNNLQRISGLATLYFQYGTMYARILAYDKNNLSLSNVKTKYLIFPFFNMVSESLFC